MAEQSAPYSAQGILPLLTLPLTLERSPPPSLAALASHTHREFQVEAMRQELAALLSSVQLLREGNPGRKIAEIQGKLATVPSRAPVPVRLRRGGQPPVEGSQGGSRMSCWGTPCLRPWKFQVEAPVGAPHAGGIGNHGERSALSPSWAPPPPIMGL